MSVARWLETDSLSNQNIASAAAIGAYTADADRMVVVDVSLDQVAGNGDYVIYVTRQINGAGSAYVLLPKTTCTAASGETAIAMQSGPITVRSGDVLTVYVDGLAGDTTTPDTTVRWFEMAALQPTDAGRTLDILATGEAAANVTHHAGVAVAAADANGNVLAKLADGVQHGGVTATMHMRKLAIDNSLTDEPALEISGSGEKKPALVIIGTNTDAIFVSAGSGYAMRVSSQNGILHDAPVAMDIEGYVAELGATAKQDVRDAAKLAPSAGAPAAGSIDAHLDDILEDTGTTLPGLLAATVADSQDVTTAGTISRRRGNSWSIALTLGAITGYTSLWFTVKSSTEDADTAAVLQIKKNASGLTDGLLYVNGAAASDATKASIAIVDASTGSVLVTVDETITDDLTPGEYVYDAQTLISSATATPETGTFTVTADVTRSVT